MPTPGLSRWRIWLESAATRPAFQLILHCRASRRFALFPCARPGWLAKRFLPSAWGGPLPANRLERDGRIAFPDRKTPPSPSAPRYECFLWPDRLRWHFLLWGLVLGVLVARRVLADDSNPPAAWLDLALAGAVAIATWPTVFFLPLWLRDCRFVPPARRARWRDSRDTVEALLFLLATLLAGTAPLATLALLGVAWVPYLHALAAGLAVCLLTTVALPWLVYGCAGVPVLVRLRERWPRVLEGWLSRVLAWHPAPWASLRWTLYTPAVARRWDSIDWSPRGSPRESVLRVAIAELFSDDRAHADPWQSGGLRRWLWYWCAPVWGSYLGLALLIAAIHKGWLTHPVDYQDLNMAAYLWLLYAVVFMRIEAARLNDWGTVDRPTLDQLPPMLRHSIKRLPRIAPKLASIEGLGVFSLVNGAGTLVLTRMIEALPK